MSPKRVIIVALSVVTLAVGSASNAKATPFVLNGGFETLGPAGANHTFDTSAPADWTKSGGVAYIYAAGGADADGADFATGFPKFYLWGPDNPFPFSMNGMPDTSPHDGGNFLASDSDHSFSTPISQTINGLTPGGTYDLTFEWAAAQLRSEDGSDWNGDTHSSWQVTLGSAGTQSTADAKILSHGFSGWMDESFLFTIPTTSTGSEVLSFLAVGGPSPLPPVALLDGVSLVATPEPATLGLLGVGLLGVLRARKQQKKGARRTKSAAV